MLQRYEKPTPFAIMRKDSHASGVRVGISRPSRRQLRQIILGATVVCFFYWFLFSSLLFYRKGSSLSFFSPTAWHQQPDLTDHVLNRLSLNEKQCSTAFPGLFDSVDEMVTKGIFYLRQSNQMVTGRIRDGKIYILSEEKMGDMSDMMFKERAAALHQLHRAIVTSPEPLPDTLFALNIHDTPQARSLSYSRSRDPEHSFGADGHIFLMPHFSYWHWMRLPFISSLRNASTQITAIETATPFEHKIPKAVWRGTPWFASSANTELRKSLLTTAHVAGSTTSKGGENLPWADVQSLKWSDSGRRSENALKIEDFCRYKYVVYTEGISYSGRLQFHQLCASVLITPAIVWMQHTTHLVRPVWSTELLASDREWIRKRRSEKNNVNNVHRNTKMALKNPPEEHPSKRNLKMWPEGTTYGPTNANAVFVRSDWADLEDVIMFLEDHPELAAQIARNQRDTFHGNGYFSPAAEACYWRAVIRGWAAVARRPGDQGGVNNVQEQQPAGYNEDGDFWNEEGTEWELWVLDSTIKPPTPPLGMKSRENKESK